jgi:hypothetical protein
VGPGTVAHACIPITWDAEVGGLANSVPNWAIQQDPSTKKRKERKKKIEGEKEGKRNSDCHWRLRRKPGLYPHLTLKEASLFLLLE